MSHRKHYSWSVINQFSVQLISFLGNILIARQLTPDDYGLVAMLAIFMGIAWNFTESGFADFLIRKQDADKKDFATIFIHNITFALLLYGLLYISAPYISHYFERQELIEIARVLGLSLVIKAITVVEFTRMRKELMFKNTTIIQIVSSIFSLAIAYLMAINGFGYWAIVMQTLSIAIINLVMIMILNKWRPYFYFSWERYKSMRGFSNNMLLSYFSNQIGNNLYSVFIGKYHSISGLGFYNQAAKINDACFQSINAVILTTSYPLLANEKNRDIRREMYNSLLNHFLFIQFSISLFIIGIAYPLIELLFGDKWVSAAPLLQLLMLSFLFYPLTTINQNIIKIEGRSALYRNLTFLRNGLNFIALLLTYSYSIEMLIVGQIIARYLSVTIDVIICGKIIDFNVLKQLKIVGIQILSPTIAMIIAFSVSMYFNPIFLKFSIYLSVFVIVFYLSNKIIQNKTQDYYQEKFKLLLNKIKK
jgi:teichuronic acid exporter